jgi:flavin-dependent dehydrogenase
MARPDADVAVVGAGPAGAVGALLAARSGHRVTVFDRARFPRDKPCGEGLMPPGRRILADLGLESDLIQAGAPNIEGVVIGLGGGPTVKSAFPNEETGLGVRRLRFDAVLADRLAAEPRIEFSQGVAVERVEHVDGLVSLQTSAGAVSARSIAVADGLRSGLRRQLGWTQGPRPPHRYGVVGHWRGEFPPDSWIRLSIESGFETYRAPVGPDEHLLALLCDRAQMAAFSNDLIGQYRARARAAHPDLEGADLSGTVSAIGPFRYGAKTVAQDGIFLVGDASGFVDPITGEGLASGLAQAQAFARALDHPHPEAIYRRLHRRITRDPRRFTALVVYLATNARRAARAVHGMQRLPSAMPRLLGINLGYWGFGRVTPREWVALLAGR